MNNYLVDTSIWIDFFRGNSKIIKNRILNLLDENRIYYNGIILSELLIGTNSKKEFNFINENFSGLNYLKMEREKIRFSSSLAERRKKDKAFGKMVKNVMKEKKNNKY